MKIISHRRNTIAELKATDQKYGVEVDIRSRGGRLIVNHDPFVAGEYFDEWVDEYKHGTLILNIKEEGLESRLIDLMALKGIEDYFFLDQSFPFLVKWAKSGERRCAVRVSEFEAIETALTLAGQVDWIWVDCFTKFPLSLNDFQQLKNAMFKLCLVSPELQGRSAENEIYAFFLLMKERNIEMDAVCTKRPELWDKWCSNNEENIPSSDVLPGACDSFILDYLHGPSCST